MKNSIKRNLGYQTIYQILNTCLPLITAPYLARILGAENLGIYSFVTSISSFFALLAMLGIANYGTRSIAECGNDKVRVTITFKEIYTIQLFMSVLCTVLYIEYAFLLGVDNRIIVLLQGIAVLACAFDINWLFFGLEEFKLTVIRNMVIRVSTVALMLIIVKNENHLWIYTLLMASSTLISNLVLWFYLPERITNAHIDREKIKRHFKPIAMLFVPLLAMSVYHLMDKAMLGWLSTYEESGYYYNADKIINIPVGILLGVGTVMLPRITALVNSGKKQEADGLFLKTVEVLIVVSTAISFGIAAISNEFIPFFFGEGYDSCVLLTIVLCPVLIIKALSLTIRNVYLVPNHKDKYYIQSVVAGAIINTIINYLLIPRLNAMGAVIGTLVAEAVACVWQYYAVRRELHYGKTLIQIIPYLMIGCVMFGAVRFVANEIHFTSLFLSIVLEIIIGALIFSGICVSFWAITKNDILKIIFNRKI